MENVYSKMIKKHFWIYLVEVVAAIVIYKISFTVFLIYVFMMLMLKIDVATDFLRKLIRVFQIFNEGKLMSIIEKLKISQDELQKMGDDMENKMTDEQKKEVYEDMNDLGLK